MDDGNETEDGRNMKRGITFYSFMAEYNEGRMSLEDCIATAAQLSLPGIEILGPQMVEGFPTPPDLFFERWHGLMAQYGTTPVCLDMFLDAPSMRQDDILAAVVRDLDIAARLGCTVLRMVVLTPPEVMALAAPYAEQRQIQLGLEIHAPYHLDHDWIKRHIEVMERLGSPYLGLIPDLGVVVRRFPRIISERQIRNGASEKIVAFVVEQFNSHEPLDDLVDAVRRMGGNEHDLNLVHVAQHLVYMDPRRLRAQMERIVHFHAKFYEMLPDLSEYSIPYDEVIAVLIEGGYSGYLSSEYEGTQFIRDVSDFQSVEQIRRQQRMFDRLLG